MGQKLVASQLKLKKVICFDLRSERHEGQIWEQAMTCLCKYYHTNCHMNIHGNLMPTNLRCTGVGVPPLRSIWPCCSVRSLWWVSAPTLFFGYMAKQMASQHKRSLCLRIHWENDESARMWPAFKNIPACSVLATLISHPHDDGHLPWCAIFH